MPSFAKAPSKVSLYCPRLKYLNRHLLKEFVEDTIGIKVEIHDDFFLEFKPRDEHGMERLACLVARARIRNTFKKSGEFDPLYGEVVYEEEALRDAGRYPGGTFYDAHLMQAVLLEMIPPNKRKFQDLHIIITPRLFGTFVPGEGRYHARAIICCYPSAISLPGIVEGPAKPREFYKSKNVLSAIGTEIPHEIIKPHFQGRFVDYGDSRITEVLKGYILQAFFWHAFGEAFCEDKDCRLYDAHWQEDLIHSQIESGRLCKRHQELLKRWHGARHKNPVHKGIGNVK